MTLQRYFCSDRSSGCEPKRQVSSHSTAAIRHRLKGSGLNAMNCLSERPQRLSFIGTPRHHRYPDPVGHDPVDGRCHSLCEVRETNGKPGEKWGQPPGGDSRRVRTFDGRWERHARKWKCRCLTYVLICGNSSGLASPGILLASAIMVLMILVKASRCAHHIVRKHR